MLIRLKSDIRLKKVSGFFPDGSYLAEVSGEGATVTVRVIEYCADVEGQDVPEMFCLATDLLDWEEYPAADLAALYRWRWDGSETALREAKSALAGAGPSTGPMLRSKTPGLVRQELAAWAAAVEMTRGVARDAALAAVPARKGRRAGQPVQPREISFTAARRAIIAAIRHGAASYALLASALGMCRVVIDRNRHRARKAKARPGIPRRRPRHRYAHRRSGHNRLQYPRLTRKNASPALGPVRRPVEPAVTRHDTPASGMP